MAFGSLHSSLFKLPGMIYKKITAVLFNSSIYVGPDELLHNVIKVLVELVAEIVAEAFGGYLN